MRLDEAPGVGPVLATALVAAVADPKSFRSGRDSGLDWARAEAALEWRQEPARQYKYKVTAICAACSWPARSLSSVTPRFMAPDIGPGSRLCWHGGLPKVAAIALVYKIARMVWAMMARGERYKEPFALAR